MLSITDPYVAYCFDEAVGEFGSSVKAQLEAVEGKTAKAVESKQTQLLKRLLEEDDERKFASVPAPTMTLEDLERRKAGES